MDGLNLAGNMGYRFILLESESKMVMEMLLNDCSRNGKMGRLRRQCMKLLQRNWVIKIQHIFRKDNKCANWFVYFSIFGNLGLMVTSPPPDLRMLLLAMFCGVSTTRIISRCCWLFFFFSRLLVPLIIKKEKEKETLVHTQYPS